MTTGKFRQLITQPNWLNTWRSITITDVTTHCQHTELLMK